MRPTDERVRRIADWPRPASSTTNPVSTPDVDWMASRAESNGAPRSSPHRSLPPTPLASRVAASPAPLLPAPGAHVQQPYEPLRVNVPRDWAPVRIQYSALSTDRYPGPMQCAPPPPAFPASTRALSLLSSLAHPSSRSLPVPVLCRASQSSHTPPANLPWSPRCWPSPPDYRHLSITIQARVHRRLGAQPRPKEHWPRHSNWHSATPGPPSREK